MTRYLLFFFIIQFLITFKIEGQSPCYDAPSLDFSGTPVRFSYLLEDTVITDWCQGITFSRHRGSLFTKPLEYEDMFVLSAKSITGSIILGVDQKTHEVLWNRHDNHLINRQQRSLSVGAYRKKGGDSLEMITYHSLSVFNGNSMNAISGFPGRRVINYKTGEMLSDYWVGDSLKVEGVDFSKGIYIVYLGNDEFPVNISGSDMYHFAFPTIFKTDSSSFRINHRYVDTTTLIAYWQNSPLFQLQGIAAPPIFLDCSENGIQPSTLQTFGPFMLPAERKMYFLRYFLNGYFRTRKIVLDKWGYLLENEDLTQTMGEANAEALWLVSDVIETQNNHFLLRGNIKNLEEFWEWGHASYIVIDSSGQLITSRKKLQFDGLRPFLHNVCELPERNSLLHVFRPQENNDLYFYEEYADGTYRQAGHLVNPNDAFYAFEPHQMGLMENGDVYVYLTGLIDSLSITENSNFNSGGWQAMIRVDGQALGIATSTKDIGNNVSQSTIYPNPASTDIRIQTTRPVYPLAGEIINQLGQIVRTFDLHDDQQSIDVSALPSGMYFVRSYDPKTRLNVSIGKWMKE